MLLKSVLFQNMFSTYSSYFIIYLFLEKKSTSLNFTRFFFINVIIRASFRAPRLISRALKLTTM
jgi:hypothetical protein